MITQSSKYRSSIHNYRRIFAPVERCYTFKHRFVTCTDDSNTSSFFVEAERIVTEDYVPSIEDIEQSSKRGIVETHFSADESSIRVLQIYCQLGHFTKWMRIFDPKDITSIMFYASLCDYDEPCVDSSLGEQVCVLPSRIGLDYS